MGIQSEAGYILAAHDNEENTTTLILNNVSSMKIIKRESIDYHRPFQD